ncbi:MAG: CidA/LrgA family protein [Fibrobacter sp.]|nr:CidA/LrgA family protein [Fibrobacter sp.]
MRILLQLALIIGISLIGEILHRYAGVPIPGNILGMLILLLLLCVKVVKLDHIKEVSDFFLKNIAFFFLPPSIGIMAAGEEVMCRWPVLLIMCIALTIVTMTATGWTVQLLAKGTKHKARGVKTEGAKNEQ